MKVESKEFADTRDNLIQQIETIRFATYDNFRVIRATDNFIEKYLPFQIQEIVSENILGFVKRPFSVEQIMNGVDMTMSKEQKAELERYESFKAVEYDSYKKFHRAVLNDDGIPRIKKTTFRMPGYRQILDYDQEEGYVINNEKIYNRAHKKRIKNKSGAVSPG